MEKTELTWTAPTGAAGTRSCGSEVEARDEAGILKLLGCTEIVLFDVEGDGAESF